MKQIRAWMWGGVLTIGMLAGLLFSDISNAANAKSVVAKVASSQGSVQAKRKGQTRWVPVALKDTFNAGDVIRVQNQSRAAIILLSNETVIRLDQNTTLTLSGIKKKKTSVLDLLKGAVHFISRVPRTLKVNTPHVNATVEGTEFVVNVLSDRTFVTVFEGKVLAQNNMGSLALTTNQSAVAIAGQAPKLRIILHPRDAVQWALYYPTVLYYQTSDFTDSNKASWQEPLRRSIRFFQNGDISKAFDSIKNLGKGINDPRFFNYRATLLLSVGRAGEAISDIDQALKLSPDNSQSMALKSIIYLAKNNKSIALVLAEKAVESDSQSAAALTALSYVQQAAFAIEDAHLTMQKAVEYEPANSLMQARLAELWLAKGDVNKAVASAKKAVSLNSDLARTQTVLGFAYLSQIKIKESINVFNRAITLDQAAPLPRLGMGLAKIRKGEIKEGRREIEIAASLDPNQALIRSYLGKAYYEEKRNKLAGDQFNMSKTLDPLDPTPFFYDAIRKQSVNRPVEALHDLETAMELNDNRAVYRSRMLLDEDLAARSASLSKIYNNLGFQQLALTEGWKALNTDPSSHSAHRYLSDLYSALPRHEIARVSELLQSQLLQPINVTPIQPQLAESKLFIFNSAGPADVSFNEFNQLFDRDQFKVQASGILGENDTYGDEFVHSGIIDKLSYSIGQFHYETDGFRENNDQDQDIYNLFAQYRLTPKTSVQTELRYTDRENGDLTRSFDLDDFNSGQKLKSRTKTMRLGIHHAFSPNSDIILSFIGMSKDTDRNFTKNNTEQDSNRFLYEMEYLFRSPLYNIIVGGGHLSDEIKKTKTSEEGNPTEEALQFTRDKSTTNIHYTNAYVYTNINFLKNLTFTLGGSINFVDNNFEDNLQFNPKLGITWKLLQATTIRAAIFRTIERTLEISQTIEPTQIAGFNQFFEDGPGTKAWRSGIAIDQKFSNNLFGGAELSKRKLDVPFKPSGILFTKNERFDRNERLARAYLYWAPNSWLSLSAEFQYERFFKRHPVFTDEFTRLRTHRVPLGVNFFHDSGFSLNLEPTYINQQGEFGKGFDNLLGKTQRMKDQFWILDGSIKYRLPNRHGIISIEGKNIFNKDFNFLDTDPANPQIYPESLILARFTLSL